MDKGWETWRDRRVEGSKCLWECTKFPGKASGSLYCLQVEHTHLTSERGHRGDGVAVLGWGRELRRRAGRHLHGEIGDEGFLGQLHLEGNFLHSVSSVDYTAGDNRVGKSGRDLGVHSEAVDVDIILDQ